MMCIITLHIPLPQINRFYHIIVLRILLAFCRVKWYNKNRLWFGCRFAEVFKSTNHFGMFDDKMNGRCIVLWYYHPFPHIDLNLNISESLYSICMQVISVIIFSKLHGRRKMLQIFRICIFQSFFRKHTAKR